MRRICSIFLAIALLCTALPLNALAFDSYEIYSGRDGCRLLEFSVSQSLNPWLLWDVEFDTFCDGRVLETNADHPHLLGRTVVPTFTYEGTALTFNGVTLESGVTEVVLKAENELVVYDGDQRAEYQVTVTEETNGIPVVLIDTDGASIPDKVNYVDTAITILGADVYGGKDIYAATGGIKLRGNSTMGYDKKPYRIKFDSKQNVFGLGKAKSWVLLANYLDPASIRNDVAYAFATRLSALTAETTGYSVYVPRTRPVEVYLNGEYKGLYDMGDHVQVDGTRIDIDDSGDEFDDNDVQLYPEGDVGYYLEIEDPSRVIPEWYSESAYYVTIKNSGGTGTGTLYTGNKNPDGTLETAGTGKLDTLYVQIKTPEIPSEEQIAYITDYLQTVNDLILAKDERVFEYIDIDGFIDWYLVNELFKNTDSAFLSSVKMFKDKSGKLYMGPVWDFDIGSGAVAYNTVDSPVGWLTRSSSRCGWYQALFQMDSFVEAVEKRWADLHDTGVFDALFEDIDGLIPYLSESAEEDYTMWHDSYVNAVNNTGWLTVPAHQLTSNYWIEQVQYFRAYMKARISWMDEQFGYAEAVTSPYVNMLSSAITCTSSSRTYTVNQTYNVKQFPYFFLTVTSQGAFDIVFNFDIGSASLSGDYKSPDGNHPFVGTNGEAIAAGTYQSVQLNVAGFVPYSSNPDATTITLESITVKANGSRRNVKVSELYAAFEEQTDVSGDATAAIRGEVFIAGIPEYNSTVTADTMAIVPYGAGVSYQWYADGEAIDGATSANFTPDASYIGKNLTVTVSGLGGYSGSVTSEPVEFRRDTYTYRTTQIPELLSKSHDTLTIAERVGYEISVDGVNWQTSGTFTGLSPNTLYRVYYRHGVTELQTAGTAGTPLHIITDVDPNPPVGLAGDADLDGTLSTTDAKLILRHGLGQITLSGVALRSADFDGDGHANTTDARALLKAIVNS